MRTLNPRKGKYNAQVNKQEGNGRVEEKRETQKEEIERGRQRIADHQFNLSFWKNTGTNNQTACTLKIASEMNNSQQGFVKYKLCQINLIFFYEKVTDFVERRKREDVIYLDFNIAFVSHVALPLPLTSQGNQVWRQILQTSAKKGKKKQKKTQTQLQLTLIYNLTGKCTY